MNEYAATKEDLEGGGGGSSAKPRGNYTGAISRAKAKKDKNNLVYLGFGISLTKGKLKERLVFENYLPLSNKAPKFQVARRNSFFRAIGLNQGTIPPGAPGGADVAVLNGTLVDFTLEHTFEDVPGEDYDVSTSKWDKSKWVSEGWEDCLDDKGRIVRTPSGQKVDEPIEPREAITFYNLSDDFDGVGSGADSIADDGFTPDAAADDEDWG